MKVYISETELNAILESLENGILPPCGSDGWQPSNKDIAELIKMAEECENDWRNPNQRKDFLKYITYLCWISDYSDGIYAADQKTINAFINERLRSEDF